MGYRIVTDSGSDLSACMAKELDVDLVSLHSVMKNSKGDETIDGNALALSEVYALLRQRYSATTSAVNVDAFTEIFETILKQGEDVLYLGLSSGLSATYMASRNAAEELEEKYPDRRVVVVDSLCASLGQGLIVKLAADKKKEGADIDAVAAYVEEIKLNLVHWFTVEDLFFLKRGGRVSATTAVVGTMLQIKPVLHVDNEGKLVSMDKVRGRQGSIKALLDKMKATATEPAKQTVFISHGDCYDDAKKLADMITEELGVTDIFISEIGPVIGAHSGPGTVALFYLGTER
jgi:DegV family protein with EDD domain